MKESQFKGSTTDLNDEIERATSKITRGSVAIEEVEALPVALVQMETSAN